MGWYAFYCGLEHFWRLESPDYVFDALVEQVQFFIDCMTIEDDGEHFRGAFPRDSVDVMQMHLTQLWQETDS
jgi:hypothetical protein